MSASPHRQWFYEISAADNVYTVKFLLLKCQNFSILNVKNTLSALNELYFWV